MKGIINENIVDMLKLRPLDEVLKEKGVDVHADDQSEEIDEKVAQAADAFQELMRRKQMVEGTDHAESMDDMHEEILQHARDLMAYGFNIDHPRARGIFEIAAAMYGHAMTAKNSKRDAQLKAMKLSMDRRRVDLEEKRTNHMIGQIDATTVDGTLGADRNELLRQIRRDQP